MGMMMALKFQKSLPCFQNKGTTTTFTTTTTTTITIQVKPEVLSFHQHPVFLRHGNTLPKIQLCSVDQQDVCSYTFDNLIVSFTYKPYIYNIY
eukprot:m.49965 g.49965  ORF g.49965 m.49965 type:complete len:93 (-) comp7480_c1_seq2:359-637(-)